MSVLVFLIFLVSVALRAARVALAIFFICWALAVMSVLVFLIFLAVSWAREVWARASVDTASLIMRETSSALALISSLRALRSRADLAWTLADLALKAMSFFTPSLTAMSRSWR